MMMMMYVCVYVAVDLAHKFGLTAEQFGENLRDQYQRHDVEQDPAEPLELAEQYIAGYVLCVCLSVCLSVSVSVNCWSWLSSILLGMYCVSVCLSVFCQLSAVCILVVHIQGAPKKSNPLGKIRYLQNCSKFFRQIYRFYRRGFRPHILQISLEYLVAFENYNYLNLNVHFSK